MRAALVGIAIGALMVGGCNGAAPGSVEPTPTLTVAPSLVPSASPVPTPTVVPTVAPTPPAVTSTTVAASSAPKGAISVAFLGPPPHYGPATITANAGDLVFSLSNSSLAGHTIAIGPKVSGSILTVSNLVEVGHTAVFTVHGLTPGTYAYWCTIDGHAAEGMTGTLTVK